MLSQLTTAQTSIMIFGVIWLSSSFFHLFPSLMRQRSESERFKGSNGFRRSHGEENDVLTFNNKETKLDQAINSKFLKFREIEGQISEAEMEGIEHKMVAVNGINMHIAEKGQGPVVLMLHGFPELWYSWRHQIVTLAASGYRAVAPDLRGYGDTDAPPSFHSYTTLHIVGDLIALIDALGQDKVFVVGHDWGAMIAWCFCLYRPDRVKALVNLSVPFAQRKPLRKPIETYRAVLGHDYYICRFQEPGEIEAEIAEAGAYNVLKKLLTLRDPGPLIIPKKTWLEVSPSSPTTLPSWLSEEDVNYFASKFEEKGFTGGLNYYRAMDLSWELTAAWTGVEVKVPVKFIVGDQDLVYNMPGRKEYIHGGGFKKDVPFLQEIVVIEGAAHFINQERAEEISQHIYDFIQKF